MTEESVHQLCTSAFSPEEIVEAKSLLFESMPNGKKMPVRRKEGKKRVSRDLDDIISHMKSCDMELYPIFVARDLHKLPPVTFDHVDATRLLKDILKLKNQVEVIEEKCITVDQFNLLKADVENIKHASIVNNFNSTTTINSNYYYH